jgi:hypothetical protein
MIVKVGDRYRIVSRKGKVLGEYRTHHAALVRLAQIEAFKRMDEERK